MQDRFFFLSLRPTIRTRSFVLGGIECRAVHRRTSACGRRPDAYTMPHLPPEEDILPKRQEESQKWRDLRGLRSFGRKRATMAG